MTVNSPGTADTVTVDGFDMRVLRQRCAQMKVAFNSPGRITAMNKAAAELLHAAETVTSQLNREGK